MRSRIRRIVALVLGAGGFVACTSADPPVVAVDTGDSSGADPTTTTVLPMPTSSSSSGVASTESTSGTSSTEDTAAPETSTSTSSSSSSSSSTSTETGVGTAPPVVLLVPDVVAPNGWLYLGVDNPPMAFTLDLDGVPLGEPDEDIFAQDPIGVWRVPADTPLGDATLFVRWADEPDSASEIPLVITAPRFVDVAGPTGLAQTHDVTGSPAECAESHTGVAMGDYDGDALPDVYVGNVGTSGRLFRNLGNIDADTEPDFVEVTDDAGLAGIDSVAMATFVDLEGDGDQDLFIGRRGTNRMFENRLVPDGTATYVDVTAALGLDIDSQRTMGVAFGDYDNDGDLDLYEVNHAFCFPEPGFEIRAEDHLYRNDGGVFVERTFELSPFAGISVGFAAAWVDLERDGDQDLIVINDDVGGNIGDPNEVWRNDGPGVTGGWSFTDVSVSSGLGAGSWNGMGIALGDVDGDGFVDVAFTNVGANVLMLNQGDGTFEDVSIAAGIERAQFPWGRDSITWATHLWDHDNDGDLDLYFSGGPIQATGPVSDAFFDNVGDATFVDLTWASALADPAHGKASALGDFDRDGAWDLVTAAWSDELRVWRNQSVGNHYLDVELVGRAGNRDALGAIIELTTDAGTQTCFHTQRPSLGAGGELACHFGLGSETEITTLRIFWPEGTIEDVTPPLVDQRIAFVHPTG